MSAVWVYAVTDRDAPLDVPGVRDEPVRAVRHGTLTAAVSSVPLAEFGREPLHRNLSDLAWLEPVARAHHAVVARVAERGPVVPLRLASVYRDDAGVAALLAERADDLTAALGRVTGCTEWGVKAYAPPAPPPAEVATEGSPGARYLAQRRAERTARERVRHSAVDLADRVDRTLRPLATAYRRHDDRQAWPAESAAPVVTASYLVADDRRAAFTDAVAGLAATDRVDLTGPWPPYSFAGLDET